LKQSRKKSKAYKHKRQSNLKIEGDPTILDPKILKKETTDGNIPEILSGVIFNPYESIKKMGISEDSAVSLTEFQCKKCHNWIHPTEIRIAFRINSEFIGWCHKKC
jgi:hypothetical protein